MSTEQVINGQSMRPGFFNLLADDDAARPSADFSSSLSD